MSDPLWVNSGKGDDVGTATLVASSDTWTLTAHGLSDRQAVLLDTLTGGASGVLVEGGIYYVRDATADTFTLAETADGPVIDFTSDGGADVHTVVGQYQADELRRAQAALLLQGQADRFGARAGVRPGPDVVSLAGTTVTVHDHAGVGYPGLSTTAGPYLYQHLENTHELDPADGTNDRIDAIDIQTQDDDEDASGERRVRSVYVVGTPGATPVAPALTANAFRAATALVPAGGTPAPTLTYVAPAAVTNGGILPVRDDTEYPTAGLYDGLTLFDQALAAHMVSVGGIFQRAAERPSHVPLDSHSFTSAATSHTFTKSAIDAWVEDFDTFEIHFQGNHTDTVELGGLLLRLNGDSGASAYRASALRWDGAGAVTAENNVAGSSNLVVGYVGRHTGKAHVTLGRSGAAWQAEGKGWAQGGTTGSSAVTHFQGGGRWASTVELTSIQVLSSRELAVGTRITLVGVRG